MVVVRHSVPVENLAGTYILLRFRVQATAPAVRVLF